jgi:hypothetical protein
VRAFLILVGFVVAAFSLVAVGTRPSVSGNAAPPPTTTTTTTKSSATTTTTTIPHGSVTVTVANATGGGTWAAHFSAVLAPQGWAMQPPRDATTTAARSTVYYAAGQQEAAASIATTLGIEPASVVPLTTAVPVAGVSSDDVVVVIGTDLATVAGS